MKTPNLLCHSIGKSRYRVTTLLYLFLFSFSSYCFSQQLAFPSAEGFGKFASGGRGGQVIKVTNLNDSGSGSLRAALQYSSGPRTIVFEVGGTITLNSALSVTNGNVTVAGQTAPGDGILIRGSMVIIEDSNVIIRHIRFRPGPSAPNTSDGLSITAWGSDVVENVIIDHCSISWSTDENFNLRAASGGRVQNITIQNSIIAEGGYGVLMGPGTLTTSFYKNLLAHNQERNIRTGYPVNNSFQFEMINNLIYGCIGATGIAFGSKHTVLNNHYRESSQVNMYHTIVDYTSSGQGTPSETYAFLDGNIIPSGTNESASSATQYLENSPYTSSGIIPIDANLIATDILPHVGASLPNRDAVDVRLIDQYNNGNGTLASTGTYPTISGGTAPVDTDNDGMPDSWEIENGLNINDASDRNILQPDGYTNLEYYLNFMTLGSTTNQVIAGNDITICQGETATLNASDADSYIWTPGNLTGESIDVSPTTTTTYTVTGSHSDGSTTTDSIVITVNPIPVANAGQDVETCQGNSVTLSASGGTSYLWNTGATTQSISVNPNTTTTYSVEVTENGCTSDLDEVIVTVNPLPSVDAGLDVTINYGESTVLTATGADSYIWSTGATTESITVNPTLETTYTVTGTTGTCQNTDAVTVFLIGSEVVANAGEDQTICDGLETTLTATGGTAYVWNTGETTASITVSPTNTTTYTVTAFDSTGTVSDTDDVIVTVTDNPIANAGNDVEICQGASVTLTASGGSNYIWNTGETSQSITVNPNTSTTYSVEVIENNCSSIDEVSVTVNALPSVDAGIDVYITEGNMTTLVASGAETYLWSTGETTASIEVNPASTTTYFVTGFSNGCEATDELIVFVETESVIANAGEDVSICEGESTILTASGGATYQWSTGETSSSIEVNPNVTTTFSVTVFNSLGTSSDTDNVIVTVNAIPIANAGNDIELCQGASVTLTASGGSNYIWTTGETSQSITVSPNATTTYSVEVIQNNCSSTDEVTVFINDLPNVNAGSNVTITEGESTTLSASGAESYLWSTGETSQTIEVSPNTTTTYTVTGFSNGCEATDEVTVIVEPIVFIANAGENQFICQGTSTILTVSEGDSYLWSTGETTQSITVSPWATETYTVTVFEGNEQAQDDVTVNVNLNPNVVIMNGGEVTILEGEFITLSASGANTYEWNNGATQPNIAVSPLVSTTYSVTGYINNCSDEKSVTVNVVEAVEAYAGEDLTICSDEMVTLTAIGGEEYLWNTGETSQSINVAPGTDTEYSVLVYNALSSDEASVTVYVNDCSSVEIPQVDQEFNVLIYQEATADVLKVKISGMDRVDVDQIMIYDITGKIIYKEQIKTDENTQSLDKEIDSTQFSRGIYIVRLLYDDTELLKKIPIR